MFIISISTRRCHSRGAPRTIWRGACDVVVRADTRRACLHHHQAAQPIIRLRSLLSRRSRSSIRFSGEARCTSRSAAAHTPPRRLWLATSRLESQSHDTRDGCSVASEDIITYPEQMRVIVGRVLLFRSFLACSRMAAAACEALTGDHVAAVSIAAYNKLPKTGKPMEREWTVLATLVLEYPPHLAHTLPPTPAADKRASAPAKPLLRVVALGTGNRCLGHTSVSPTGDVLHDAHAEVVARRSLLRCDTSRPPTSRRDR